MLVPIKKVTIETGSQGHPRKLANIEKSPISTTAEVPPTKK